MFLASFYPVSEKSSVNLTGKINESIINTYEENEEIFKNSFEPEILKEITLIEQPVKNENDEMEIVKEQFIDKSEEGEYRDENKNVTTSVIKNSFETLLDLKRKQKLEKDKVNKNKPYTVDYDLYKTFWGFQKFLRSENKICCESKEKWEIVVRHIQGLLITLI